MTITIRRVHLIVNPGAGLNDPVLNAVNDVLTPREIVWDVSVTHRAGDAARLARRAVDDGVDAVLVYGGDGTVREVGGVLKEAGIPMAILPGGTGNLFAVELGMPRNIRQAARLIVEDPHVRRVDMGLANNNEPFLVGAATGLIAGVMEEADRDLKSQFGILAYFMAGTRRLLEPQRSMYRITLDGGKRVIEQQGVACLVSNAGSVGISGLSVPSGADLSDGKLHVVVFRGIDLPTIRAAVSDVVGLRELARDLPRWSASAVSVESSPVQRVTCDGDIIGDTPLETHIEHEALKVIAPRRRNT